MKGDKNPWPRRTSSSEKISNLIQVYPSGGEDTSLGDGGYDDSDDDGWSYRLGWKAMPLARDDLDSNYSRC